MSGRAGMGADIPHFTPARDFAIPNLPGALCQEVDPELFFPEVGGNAGPAKRICRSCDVNLECLKWAMDHDEIHGIWGGLSPNQRTKLRMKLRRERKAA